MDSDLDKELEKMYLSEEYNKRKLWIYRRKVISVDDEFVTFDDRGEIHRWDIDEECFRTREYREWLVDSGYWIPSMDLRESGYDVSAKKLTEEEEAQLGIKSGTGNENKEDLTIRMKKLKVQQQGKFKKYYERQEPQKEKEKSRNSKSKVDKSMVDVKTKKVETVKKEKPKPQKTSVEKVKKVGPPKAQDQKKPEKTPTGEAREGKVETQDPSKSGEPKTRNSSKPEYPRLKETVRSHYCYTEMHLFSGKDNKNKN